MYQLNYNFFEGRLAHLNMFSEVNSTIFFNKLFFYQTKIIFECVIYFFLCIIYFFTMY